MLAVHTGAGKGKSTAAFGMALRAWNAGLSIGVFQFVKSAKWRVGEESAFGHLAQLPATTLKIDRVFVRDLGTSARADQLVRSTFELARTLGLTAVAEGVETVSQAHALAAMGCELHQGFLFARPMPTPEFERLLRHHRDHPPAEWAAPLLPEL